jgi:hypothetical protein
MAWDLPADQPAPARAKPARTDASNLSTSRPRLEGALTKGGDYFRKRTPNAPPDASSHNSKRSDTASHSNQSLLEPTVIPHQ